MAMMLQDTATPTLNHGLGFTSDMPHSRESSSGSFNAATPHASSSSEFQVQDTSDALAFARRILSTSSSISDGSTRSRTVSNSSLASAEYAYQQYSPEAGPSSPPPALRSSSSSTASVGGGPPQLPPRRRSRGMPAIEQRNSHASISSSSHRHASSNASAERQALAKLVSMYENLVSLNA